MIKKFKQKDKVQVITGKDKGKKGEILKVITKQNKVVVSGVNVVTRHMKPSKQNPNGGIIKKELPIDISNIMFLDPKLDMPSRVGLKYLPEGKKVRFAKKSKELIDV